MVAELAHIQRLGIFFRADGNAQCGVDVADGFALEGAVFHGFLHVQDLAAERQDGLELAVAALLGRSACGVALHEEELAVGRVAVGAVGQLAREAAARHHGLALNELAGLAGRVACRCGKDHLVDDGAGVLRVLFEILVERGADGLRNGGHHLAVAQLGLGLALELGLGHFHRNDGRQTLTEVRRVEVELQLREQAVLVGVALQRGSQAAAETAQVRTAFYRVDVVDVGVDVLAEARVVLHRDLDRDDLVGLQVDGLLGEFLTDAVEILHEFDEAVLRIEHLFLRRPGHLVAVLIVLLLARTHIAQREADALVQVGQFAETAGQDVVVIDGRCRKYFFIRLEGDDRTGVGSLAHDLHVVERLALRILLYEDLPFAVDLGAQVRRECVDAGDAHAVQTAGHLVAVLAELAAGVEDRQHDLQRTALFLLVQAGRDTAAVIGNRNRIVGIDGDDDVVAIAGQRLVDRVVHHLIDQMVQTAGADVADIHGGALAHRLKTFQHLDTVGRIGFVLLQIRCVFFHSSLSLYKQTKIGRIREKSKQKRVGKTLRN